ncbi:S9 family peptidase [Psychromonas sp. MME2]|uniref:S9 family peptidase n=1 Tax=unclassified Psychromonas TaxID=2614957 RepID=UPI00339CCF4F
MQTANKRYAPYAPKKRYIHEMHGHQRCDDYFWLRDDKRESADVLNYLKQENAYTEHEMAPLATLQNTLYKEMVARQEPALSTVPYFKNGFYYLSRFDEGKDYPIYSRHEGTMDAADEIYLDCNQRAIGHEYYELGDLTLSSNAMLLAFSEDVISRRQYRLYFKNLQTNEVLDDIIEDVSAVVWANDNKTVFYVKQHPKTLLPYQVYRHTLGDAIENDQLVYQESDESFYVDIYKTRCEQYVVIYIESSTTSECLLLDANYPLQPPQIFLPRSEGHEYRIDHFQGLFYIRTNLSGKNFALQTSRVSVNSDSAHWKTLISAREAVLLEDFELMSDWLVVEERSAGLPQLRQIHYNSGESKLITFNDPAYSVFSHYNPDPNSSKFRYQYTSFTTPTTVYELDLNSGVTEILKQRIVMGGFESGDYKSERITIVARDGTNIPVTLVYRRALFNNHNPILIYGYGSYGHSLDITFSAANLSLLDRGFVYAVAHVRGGEELGRAWYEDARLLKKKNTFNDFIDVTKGLITQNYADPSKVFAMGGSAGGLLMGVVINDAAELYCGIVAAVPFVDIVSTMLDESIPLTTGEYDEWGNPNIEHYYHYMLSYSPYDQVKRQDYPNMLVTTGLHDSNVQYWEPAKWVAKLRALKTDNNQLLLYTDMEAGHGGKSGRFKPFHDTAREFAFLINLACNDNIEQA